MSDRLTQEDRFLNMLHAAWPGEVPAVALSQISLQFGARLFSLRRRGWIVTNRIVRQPDGTKHSFYKMGPRPIPPSKELRAAHSAKPLPTSSVRTDLLFDLPGGASRPWLAKSISPFAIGRSSKPALTSTAEPWTGAVVPISAITLTRNATPIMRH